MATVERHTERLQGEDELEVAVDMCDFLKHSHLTSNCACVCALHGFIINLWDPS